MITHLYPGTRDIKRDAKRSVVGVVVPVVQCVGMARAGRVDAGSIPPRFFFSFLFFLLLFYCTIDFLLFLTFLDVRACMNRREFRSRNWCDITSRMPRHIACLKSLRCTT